MSSAEKKIIIFLVAAFAIGNIVLFVKRERLKRQFARLTVEEIITRIDVNRASQEELELLPGIGPVLAVRIVEYRERHGDYKRIDDLLKVDGVSGRVVEQLKPYITLTGAP